jgi:hypothetical protein
MIIPVQPRPFAVGDAVLLRGSGFGVPGRIVRLGKRLSVFWPDLEFTGRHSPGSLMLASEHSIHNPRCCVNLASSAGPSVTLRELSVRMEADNHAG